MLISEKEMWNFINDVTKPKGNVSWSIELNDVEITDLDTIADSFNNYFKSKIDILKDNIDKELKEDPLAKIKENQKKQSNQQKKSFNLKLTNEKEVSKAMKKMKSKKSACIDCISQEILVQGAPGLVNVLIDISNKSISEGIKSCESLSLAKMAIKEFVKCLPI